MLTLSKSCKKDILLRTVAKMHSEQPLSPGSGSMKSLANNTSKSSLLVCNENLNMLDGEANHKQSG